MVKSSCPIRLLANLMGTACIEGDCAWWTGRDCAVLALTQERCSQCGGTGLVNVYEDPLIEMVDRKAGELVKVKGQAPCKTCGGTGRVSR